MWKDKLANYLIDISKYVFTGVIIASFFKDIENKFIIYGIGMLTVLVFLSIGLYILRK